HRKYYSDMPFDDFAGRIGYNLPVAAPEQPFASGSPISTPDDSNYDPLSSVSSFFKEGPPQPQAQEVSADPALMPDPQGSNPFTISNAATVAGKRAWPTAKRTAAGMAEMAGGFGEMVGNAVQGIENLQRKVMGAVGLDLPAETLGTEITKFSQESQQISSKMADKATETLSSPGYKLPPELQKHLLDNPELILDPKWMLVNVGDAAASMVPAMAAAMIGGPAMGGMVGGGMEAGTSYHDLVKSGVPKETALTASTAFGLTTGLLNKLGFDEMLAKRGGMKFLKRLAGYGKAGSVEGGTEGAEEYFQAVYEGIAKGKKLPEIYKDFKEAGKSALDVMVSAGVTGVGGAVVSDMINGKSKSSEPKPKTIFYPEEETSKEAGTEQPTVEGFDIFGPEKAEATAAEEESKLLPVGSPNRPDQSRIDVPTAPVQPPTATEATKRGSEVIATSWDSYDKARREQIVRAAGYVKKNGELMKKAEKIIEQPWDSLTDGAKKLISQAEGENVENQEKPAVETQAEVETEGKKGEVTPFPTRPDITTQEYVDNKYGDILGIEVEEDNLSNDFDPQSITVKSIRDEINNSNDVSLTKQSLKAHVADILGDLVATSRYESTEDGRRYEDYIDSLINEINSYHKTRQEAQHDTEETDTTTTPVQTTGAEERGRAKKGQQELPGEQGEKEVKQPAEIILTKSGKPYKTEKAAKVVLKGKGLADTHEIVEVDGGWGLREKKQQELPDKEKRVDVLYVMKGDMEQGEPGRQTAHPRTGQPIIYKSTYPEWFSNRGLKKKQMLTILDKAIKGKKLTENQQTILNDSLDLAETEYRQRYGDAWDGEFLDIASIWHSQMEKVLTRKLPGKGNPKMIHQMVESWAR
ncbi:MAG: hypothetical protein DRG33_08175, partial [Deltaproteobacteria bacterium]